jgi:hypothetical protein
MLDLVKMAWTCLKDGGMVVSSQALPEKRDSVGFAEAGGYVYLFGGFEQNQQGDYFGWMPLSG